MPRSTAVILVVGLNQSLIGDWSPRLQKFARDRAVVRLQPPLPAVTTTVQSSMLTGLPPAQHGIVGNGWYNREIAEVQFWKQSNHLVQGEKVWETARKRDAGATCLQMFWWYNMYSSAEWSVTPRPMYKADGRKIPDCYSHPANLRDELQERFGQFPLFKFWGPLASIESTQWIANATMHVHAQADPTLTFVYLPHLDYGLQKLGPSHPDIHKHVAEVDAVVGELLDYFESKNVEPMIVSEYGIEPVDDAVHINRVLREEGALKVRVEEGLELLDPGASEAFAVSDHQVAHVYVKDIALVSHYADLCRNVLGVGQVYDRAGQAKIGLDHARSGELVLVAEAGKWFSYYYWLDDAKAPDFARTVDIHRKPGYDPAELFIDPKLSVPKLRLAGKLFKRNVLNMRSLLDVIPLDASLVRGSHGRIDLPEELQPILIANPIAVAREPLPSLCVRDVILRYAGLWVD